MYEVLKGNVAKYKQMKHLTYEDLGEMTGYRGNTIAMFMAGVRESSAVAAALERVLKGENQNEEK